MRVFEAMNSQEENNLQENMNFPEKRNLRLNSTLGDLFLSGTIIDVKEKVSALAEILKSDGHTPGVILMNGEKYQGMISRRVFFECMSQPFSLELYLNRTVYFLFENTQPAATLVLNETTTVAEASILALERPLDLTYEPVVVQVQGGRKFKLLDIHELLLAQSRIHLLTVNSLKEANEFKSEVLSIASHDLKNPLNSIMGFAWVIKEESSGSQAGRINKDNVLIGECAEMIHASSQRMLELIKKLLDSSAIEASLVRLEKSQIDFIHLVENNVSLNEELANKKNQNIKIKNGIHGRVNVNADETRLGAAIDNLISNAIKYSPVNSTIEIILRINNASVLLEIKDEGPGIKDEEKPRLFARFSKLSSVPTGGESSNGLGLYIAKQTILLHNGDLRFESQFGKGSTFIIELPLSMT